MSNSAQRMLRLTLYGRAECHLCHEMQAVVESVAAGRPDVVVEAVDVDTDPVVARRWGEEVPVLCLNGRRIFAVRVDAAALRACLAREGG